jgi:hypothetical protein
MYVFVKFGVLNFISEEDHSYSILYWYSANLGKVNL